MKTREYRKHQAQTRACAQIVEHLLDHVLVRRRPADRELSSFLRRNRHFGSRDRRLISETVFSVFRWWGWIRPWAPDTAAAENPEDWTPLLLAAHLLETASLPPAADLWAEAGGQDPRRLLRWEPAENPLARFRDARRLLPETESPDTPKLRDLIPPWTLAETAGTTPPETLIRWLQNRPPMWLRAQQTDPRLLARTLADAGIPVHPHERLHNALNAGITRVNLYDLEPFRRGAFEIQDLASQATGHICGAEPGQRWWDACAGAGGKTLLLADHMNGKGSLLATDIREKKLLNLRRRARRGGFHNIRTGRWDGRPPESGPRQSFDGVLVDAPCSCSGTWRRNPDARWRRTPADLPEMAELQQTLLNGAADGVRPGGALIYATCSLFVRENEYVVHRFLQQHPRFRLEPFAHPLTGTPTRGTVQIWPWEGDCDAMFAARMRRTEE